LSSSVENSEGSATAAIVVLTPAKNLRFFGVSSGLPLVQSFFRICLNVSESDITQKNDSKTFERL
jgi:hypothetical protein